MDAVRRVTSVRVAGGTVAEAMRAIPAEVPVALVYDGSTQAVMLASPQDLEDFAVGFSLNEGVVTSAGEIESLDVLAHDGEGEAPGVEVRMWLAAQPGRQMVARRRRMAGPTGCGLCGIESLAAAVPNVATVAAQARFTADEVAQAIAALPAAQPLNVATRAVHAAGLWLPGRGLVLVREDVGRHNALDKLAGAVARAGEAAEGGMVVLTSRVSVEMVQKAAAMGVGVVVAVSAPTSLAVTTAERAGMTLVAVARADAFEIFTHARRIVAARDELVEGECHVATR